MKKVMGAREAWEEMVKFWMGGIDGKGGGYMELNYCEISGEEEPKKVEAEVVERYFEGNKHKDDFIHLIIPDSVEEIGDSAFGSRYGIFKVSIGKGVKCIGRGAFSCCYLSEIEIPDNVEEIDDDAFCNCYGLRYIKLGKGLKKIGRGAFYRNVAYVIELPESVEEIGDGALCGRMLRWIYAFDNPHFVSVDGVLYTSDMKELVQVPGDMGGDFKKTKRKGYKAGIFRIPEGVEVIRGWSCAGGLVFDEIEIPDSVREIREYAFLHSYIKRVRVPEGVKELSCGVFQGCSSLKRVYLPESLEEIGDSAFSDCYKLQRIEVPARVKRVGGWAFGDCGLRKIKFSERGLEEIGGDAFHSCHSLKEVVLPDTLKVIGGYAFAYCDLEGIFLPSSLEELGEGVFFGCDNLWSLVWDFNNNEKYRVVCGVLYNGDCTELLYYPPMRGLEEYEVLGSVKRIRKDAFHRAENLRRVILPEGLEEIGSCAFYGCSNLEEVNIPRLKELESCVFGYCNLKRVEIPNTIEVIHSGAFSGNDELSEVVFEEGDKGLKVELHSFDCPLSYDFKVPGRLNDVCDISFPYYVKIPEGVKVRYAVSEDGRPTYYSD